MLGQQLTAIILSNVHDKQEASSSMHTLCIKTGLSILWIVQAIQ